MQTMFKIPKFWRLALGLLSLGVSQRLFLTGAVSPWTKDVAVSMLLLVISLIFLVLGLIAVIPIGIAYYKQFRTDKRLLKSLGTYFLATVLLGLLLGLVGQLLYDHTSFSYTNVKTGIWMTTSILQNTLKIVLCFCLVSIYKQLPLLTRKNYLLLPIVCGFALTLVALVFVIWLPAIGSILISIVDMLIAIGTLYYFIYLKEESGYEKAS